MQEYNKLTDRTYLEIDVNALRHNIEIVRTKVGGDVKILCLVKANAYGHGAVAVAKYCEDFIDYLGVATVDEGIELRKSGARLPILVVGNVAKSRFADAVGFDLELTAHCLDVAKSLDAYCKSNNKIAKVHIAVDTGMGRIGFLPDEVDGAVEVCRLSNICVKGVFTHFAKADEYDKSYTYMQKNLFDKFVDSLKVAGVDVGLRHVANSASILEMPSDGYDMVRTGIMTYGLFPSADVDTTVDLRPVMSMHTHVIHIKKLPKGSSVSYGGDFVTIKDTVVATIAVGYGDGYPRALSGKGYTLVRGKRAPIIGRICMDQTMIDVTDIQDVKVGDIVTLFGCQGNEKITADDIAKLADTINYEIVCGIAPRVNKVYIYRR